MTDLPQALRVRLGEVARISAPRLRRTLDAADGSARKYLVALADDQAVECVLMRFDDGRRSACLSSQVGLRDGLRVLRHGAQRVLAQPGAPARSSARRS